MRPKGVIDGQQVNIPAPHVAVEATRRISKFMRPTSRGRCRKAKVLDADDGWRGL